MAMKRVHPGPMFALIDPTTRIQNYLNEHLLELSVF